MGRRRRRNHSEHDGHALRESSLDVRDKPPKKGTAVEWRQYDKNGHGAHSESKSGADFAILIQSPNASMLRLGVFQAKRASKPATKTGWTFNRGQAISETFEPLNSKGEEKRVQFTDLVGSCLRLHEALRPTDAPAKVKDDLDWVQYLGYLPTDHGYRVLRHEISQMSNRYDALMRAIIEIVINPTCARTSISDVEHVKFCRDWFEHLSVGWTMPEASRTGERTKGLQWLEIEPSGMRHLHMLPTAFPLMSVYVLAGGIQ